MISRIRACFTALFIAPLLVLASPASAQQAAADRYAFTQDYEPRVAMWLLADEDTKIYLLGTFHALPPGFEWRSDRLDTIIEEVDALFVETSDYDYSLELVNVDGKLTERIERRTPTSEQLSETGRERWRDLVRLSGQDFQTIDTSPLLLALLTMGTVTGEGAWASSYAYGVETVLEREFSRTDRPIRAIEDSGAVMYSIFRNDGEDLIVELEERLANWDGKTLGAFYDDGFVQTTGDAYWEAEHNWARGIVAEEFDLGFGDGPIGEAFSYNLLDRRNRLWAEWVEQRLAEPGSILMAVGAGHFEGNNSLLAMLESRGLEAQRIQ